jgi:ABC-type bacteriocin/lantibiotic exporter with double-glycine peptidase domain
MSADSAPQGLSVHLEHIRFAYPGGQFVLALEQLQVPAGKRLAVIGPSGSGKTTFLHLVAGLVVPERGSVRLGNSIDVPFGCKTSASSSRSSRSWNTLT